MHGESPDFWVRAVKLSLLPLGVRGCNPRLCIGLGALCWSLVNGYWLWKPYWRERCSHCSGAALGGEMFRRGLPSCARVVLAAVTPVKDMPYEFTGPCCVSRMDVLWIYVVGINGLLRHCGCRACVICWDRQPASSAGRGSVRWHFFETRVVFHVAEE